VERGLTYMEKQGQVIAQYRKSKKWSQFELAEALQVDIRTVQRMESQKEIKSIERRRLLIGLLGIPAYLLGLGEEQEQAKEKAIIVNADQMAFFEESLSTRWEMYYTGGTGRALRGFDTWQQELSRFAKSARGSVWHGRSLSLLSMTYQLENCLQRDLMQYEKAHQAFITGYRIAKEIGDRELMASSLAREGITLIHVDQPQKALEYFTAALSLIKNMGLANLRGYTLKGLSEAYANAGMQQESWRSIGLVERISEGDLDRVEKSLAQFNTASITAQKGINAISLHDYERAIMLIERSLDDYDPTRIRGKARLLAQKAEAYYGLQLIDIAVGTANEALLLAKSVASNKTIERIHQLHQKMLVSRWQKEPGVARLGVLLDVQRQEK
jgi:transcriptional regulator with XRE-family HTH domain